MKDLKKKEIQLRENRACKTLYCECKDNPQITTLFFAASTEQLDMIDAERDAPLSVSMRKEDAVPSGDSNYLIYIHAN